MDNANSLLLSQMNPEQARLLDQQLRNKQIQQQAQGAGLFSGAVQAGLMGANTIRGAFNGMPEGVNEQAVRKVQESKKQEDVQKVNEAKEIALFNLENNKSISEEERERAKRVIQNTTSVAQLSALAKRYSKESNQGSPAVEQRQDGSIIQIGNNGLVKEISPPTLAGFFGLTQKEFQEQHDTQSIIKANAIYNQGVKKGTPDETIREQVSRVLQPNVNDFVRESYKDYTQTAKGYANLEANLGRTVEALENANVGSLGGIKQFFGKTLEAFGIDVDSVEDTELVSRILSKEVLNNAQFMSGALSDNDIRFLKETVGEKSTSLEGLKEAFIELAIKKETAYKVTREFSKLNNASKNSFDFEAAELNYISEAREKYREMFSMEKRKSDSYKPPRFLDKDSRGEGAVPFDEQYNSFFDLPRG